MKMKYSRPQLHTLTRPRTSNACVVGSAAAVGSGYGCTEGNVVSTRCSGNGNGAVTNGPVACIKHGMGAVGTSVVCYENGNGAEGTRTACDNVGIAPVTQVGGNACVTGGDTG